MTTQHQSIQHTAKAEDTNTPSRINVVLRQRLPKPIVRAIQKYRHARKINLVNVASVLDFKVIKNLINHGDRVIDLGANMGYYTKFLSDCAGQSGTVYSIEPIPDTFDFLKYVVRKLHLSNVKLYDLAISSKKGIVEMEIPIAASGEENIFEAKISTDNSNGAQKKVTVHSTTIDDLFPATGGPISFIKCDVEGHEYECITHAVELMKRFQPSWYVEIWGDLHEQGSIAQKTNSFFEEYGYASYWFNGTHLRRCRRGDKSINYFFLTHRHVGLLKNSNTVPFSDEEK